MATIRLYSDRYSFIYLDVTYSLTATTFTLEKVIGYSSNSSYYGGSNYAKSNHFLTLPDGQTVNFATTASGGYGVNSSGWTWGLTGTLSFSVAQGSTGKISIKNYANSADYVYEAVYTSNNDVTVPTAGVLNPVPEVRFTKKDYELDNVVTVEWDKADGVTPDKYIVHLFRNNVYDSSSQSQEVSNSTFKYTFPVALCNSGYEVDDFLVAVVSTYSGSSHKDTYSTTWPRVVNACPVYISINGGEFKKLDTGVIKM